MAGKTRQPRRAAVHAFATAESCTKKSTVRNPVAWPVCVHCGLLLFNNTATRAAVAKPCPGLLDD